MTPLSDKAVNFINKCKVQIAAKNLSQLPKNYKTPVFLKSKAVQLTHERGNKMPGASEWGRCRRALVLAQTRPLRAGAGFAVITP